MIGVRAGVDDVSNRPIRTLPDRRQDRVGLRRRPGIDDHDPIRSGLDGDIAAGAGDHVEVRPQLDHFEAAGFLLADLLPLRCWARITLVAPVMVTTANTVAAAIARSVLLDGLIWQILPRMTKGTKLQ